MNLPVISITTEQLNVALTEYRERSAQPTWAGSAAFLGLTRSMLDACLAGEITHADRDAVARTLALHKTHLEAFLESVLTREKGSPAGAQFALKNQHGWRETTTVEFTERPRLSIIVEGELGRLLQQGGVMDGDIIDDDDLDWLGL